MHLPVLDGHDVLPETVEAQLSSRIEGEVRCGQHDRLLYSTDASVYQVAPLGVVVPAHARDVQTTIGICRDHGLPVLPRGAGTSLSGQTVNRAVVIDCSPHMNRLLEVHPEARTARVQPGLILDGLRDGVASYGLDFGPEVSTSTHATLGGMIANCSAGLHSLVYGMTDEHLRSVDVVLPNGQSVRFEKGAATKDSNVAGLTDAVVEVLREFESDIDERFPKVRRNVGGYKLDDLLAQLRACSPGTTDAIDLARLICGSEGSLGFITEATIDLVDAPAHTGLAILGFPDVGSALETLVKILGTNPSAVELLDRNVIDAAASHVQYGRYVDKLPRVDGACPGAVLYVDYFGSTDHAIQASFDQLQRAASKASMATYAAARDQAELWSLRKVGLGLISGGHGETHPTAFVEDLAVPPDRLCEFQRSFSELLAGHGLDVTYYAHASVGLLHMRPQLNLREAADQEAMRVIAAEATELVRRYGGTVSGEHGDGRLRAEMVQAFYGPRLVEAFRKIKTIFDPDDRFNPGLVTGSPGMLEHLRQAPEGQLIQFPEIDTFFHWDGDFGGAVEQCNGNGLCRRMKGGAMCPSYRATLDERHATRGRGNALRLAISGQFHDGTPKWNDHETLETLDLCLGCKACRYECPSAVDMARLKAEYEAQRFRVDGRVPWRTRRLGRTRQLQTLGARLAPVSNWMLGMPGLRHMIQRLLGLSTKRTMPRFERSLHTWFRSRANAELPETAPVVVLLADCFTTYGETSLGRAGVMLLEAFGYRVVMQDTGCCGRTLVSMGMLEEAQTTISNSAQRLGQLVDSCGAVAVLGLEPSCVTAIQQEWCELRDVGDAGQLNKLASMADTVERFIALEWGAHPQRPDFAPQDGIVLGHQHCHQKHESAALESFLHHCGAPSARVLDSGCCGMAGSFGYKRDQYDLSVKIAHQSLDELSESPAGTVLVAPGTSCRHQVHDVFAQQAIHPVLWAYQALRSDS
ncbi:MAG: FAD-linked oxidase C-terminal domain-containing protein [Planctomycetota bacterium]|nr:FAD-linked oxidase C-terminal domain-containing protein [Planctomycetota bacterium]